MVTIWCCNSWIVCSYIFCISCSPCTSRRHVTKAQPCVPLISTMHRQSFLIPFITWNVTYIHIYIHTHACMHTYIHTCKLLLISMLWHRQAVFESKGDKLSSSVECRIRTQGLRHLLASRLNACWQTDWAIADQAKKLELDSPSLWSASIQPTRPHCQLAFAPGSGDIHVCLLLLISMHWHRQAVLESKGDKLSSSAECRIRTQGLRHLLASRLNACWQTNWAITDQAKKLELDSPSLWSASIQSARPDLVSRSSYVTDIWYETGLSWWWTH